MFIIVNEIKYKIKYMYKKWLSYRIFILLLYVLSKFVFLILLIK